MDKHTGGHLRPALLGRLCHQIVDQKRTVICVSSLTAVLVLAVYYVTDDWIHCMQYITV